MAHSLAGTRIREHRRRKGLSQTALAAAAGISPSYLNLIEHNRRGAAGRVLVALAAALGTRPSALSEDADEALVADLRQAAALSPDDGAEVALTDDLIGRLPGWGRLISTLYRQRRDRDEVIAALSDRLTHDPFLAESVHAMLSNITAIRSAGAILTQVEGIAPAQQRKFLDAIHSESLRLSAVAEALTTYFDKAATAGDQAATPQEAADRFLMHHAHRFPTLDTLADGPDDAEPAAAAIDTLLAEAPESIEGEPEERLRAHLDQYLSDARAMPLQPFAAAARGAQFDPIALAARFDQPIHAVFRRLASLARPGIDAPAMGMVAVTASGYPLTRVPLAGFPIPRHGNACPLWPVFQAFNVPERPITALLEHDNGHRFVALALAQVRGKPRFGRAPDHVSAMLVVPEEISPFGPPAGLPSQVGTSCRICAHTDCAARSEPGILDGEPGR